MDSVAVLRSFQYAVSTSSSLKSVLEKPGMVSIKNASFSRLNKLPVFVGKNIPSANRHGVVSLSCTKTEDTITAKSNSELNGAALSDSQLEDPIEKKSSFNATFPKGFEGLLAEICDETKIAELKVKFGAFEMHMKRNIDGPVVSAPILPETTEPPVPSVRASSTPAAPPAPPKPSEEKTSPFKNVLKKASKLAALEASGSDGYVIVASPTVGKFRRAKNHKGVRGKPAVEEGVVIKEGQVLGFLDQFGTEQAVRSDVAGEVLKILYSDGESVGYGDPLFVVLPSFHDIGVQ